MCGPSASQQQIASSEQSFQNSLMSNYARQFGAQSNIYKNLTDLFTPTAEAGPSQQGFSPQELATLNTQAIDATGGNYANAARALNSRQAGQNSQPGMQSGVNQQQQEALASQEAGQLSGEQLGITQANYQQGYQNYQNALSGLEGVASGENPLGYAGQTTNAGNAAYNAATSDAMQGINQFSDVLGGLAGAGESAAKAYEAI